MKKKDEDGTFTFFVVGVLFGMIAGGLLVYGYYSDVPEYEFKQATHQVMPDEITPSAQEECIESKTVEYFAGFDHKECEKGTYEDNGWCCMKDGGFAVFCYPDMYPQPISNRTYCTKVHVVRTG